MRMCDPWKNFEVWILEVGACPCLSGLDMPRNLEL